MFTLALIVTGVLIGLKLASLLAWPWLWTFSPFAIWLSGWVFAALFLNTAAGGVKSAGHIFAWGRRRRKLNDLYKFDPEKAKPTTTNDYPWRNEAEDA